MEKKSVYNLMEPNLYFHFFPSRNTSKAEGWFKGSDIEIDFTLYVLIINTLYFVAMIKCTIVYIKSSDSNVFQ